MERLLTTRDLQQILQLDRITVYRMLEAGELPGIKIGGQWRFPEQDVKAWLERRKTKRVLGEVADRPSCDLGPELVPDELLSQPIRLNDLVSNVCLQNLQDGFAEAVGAAALVVDVQGSPLTTVSNACAFCRLGRTSSEFRKRCSRSWASMADATEEQPEVHLCHAGIGYAISPVQVHGKRIGLVVGGQFWSERPDAGQVQETASRLAEDFGLPLPELVETLKAVPVFGDERAFVFTRLLATIANAVSEIGFQAYAVRLKLQQIADIVKAL